MDFDRTVGRGYYLDDPGSASFVYFHTTPVNSDTIYISGIMLMSALTKNYFEIRSYVGSSQKLCHKNCSSLCRLLWLDTVMLFIMNVFIAFGSVLAFDSLLKRAM